MKLDLTTTCFVIAIVVLSLLNVDVAIGSMILPRFKHIVPLPQDITRIHLMTQVSFDYTPSATEENFTEWRMDGANLTDEGIRLVDPGSPLDYGIAHSVEAVSAMTTDWRIEVMVSLKYSAQTPAGWFGLIISSFEPTYNFDEDTQFGNMIGIAFFAHLQAGGTFTSTYNTDRRTPTEMVQIPGKVNKTESEPNCGPPGVIFDENGISSFTMLIQNIDDKVTLAIVPEGSINTMNICFENVDIPKLGKVTRTGRARVDLLAIQGADATNEVTVSQLRFFHFQIGNPSEALELTASDSGFPIPNLVDGNIYPEVKVRDLFECPSIAPEVKSPDYDTKIYALFKVERLVDIDAMQGSIDLFASLYLQWEVTACSSEYTAPEADNMERVYANNATALWQPKLLFTNSSNDVYMEGNFGESMQIMYVPTEPNRTLFFHWIRLGIFSSRCHLHLKYFPFDTQQCDFTFMIEEPVRFVDFGGIILYGKVLNNSDRWIFEGYSEDFGITSSVSRRSGLASYGRVKINFSRDPTHYIINLLVPCYILVMLVFGSFLMRPEMAERSAFCGMILLALTVAQSDVLKAVPQTSQRIVFAENILMLTSLTGLITLYDMAMCSFPDIHSTKIRIKCIRNPVRIDRIIDIIIFIIALSIVVSVNVSSMTASH